ncbi:MAG TPA: hypothetical protein DCP10_10685 [Bacteroidales bacterium]|nr:hypothetical protein [Bacteroidales bacterium]
MPPTLSIVLHFHNHWYCIRKMGNNHSSEALKLFFLHEEYSALDSQSLRPYNLGLKVA